jgi:hypothetical protein
MPVALHTKADDLALQKAKAASSVVIPWRFGLPYGQAGLVRSRGPDLRFLVDENITAWAGGTICSATWSASW